MIQLSNNNMSENWLDFIIKSMNKKNLVINFSIYFVNQIYLYMSSSPKKN